jgi:hypothetical protein
MAPSGNGSVRQYRRICCVGTHARGPIMLNNEQYSLHKTLPVIARQASVELSEAEIQANSGETDTSTPRTPIFWLDYARVKVCTRPLSGKG